MIRIESASDSETGHVRETNQDRLFEQSGVFSGVTCGLFCVADGMGGLELGHFAAAAAVEYAERWWYERLPNLVAQGVPNESRVQEELLALFQNINGTILLRAQEINAKVGTTCSLLLICNRTYFIAHAGDSRVYVTQKRLFGKSRIRCLTKDHTWYNDRLVEGWPLSEVEAHPNRNKLTSCLGVFDNPRIFFGCGRIKGAGAFILCSDGLYRMVGDQELAKTAAQGKHISELADEFIDTALQRGATDNVTVVTVKFS